jgi:hypothetical protein
MSDEGFIGRWSRKKREAVAPAKDGPASPAALTPPAASAPPVQVAAAVPSVPPADPHALPPLESLTSHSDFSAFLRPDVEPGMRARALKTLFGDPALYPMDGLDVYIDDYSKPDPLPEGWLEKLNQFAALDDVPAAEDAARKKEAAAKEAAAVAPPEAAGPSIEPAPEDADVVAGTPDAAGASDLLPPDDPASAKNASGRDIG